MKTSKQKKHILRLPGFRALFGPKSTLSRKERRKGLEIAVTDGLRDFLRIDSKTYRTAWAHLIEIDRGTNKFEEVCIYWKPVANQEIPNAEFGTTRGWRKEFDLLCRAKKFRWRSGVVVSAAKARNGAIVTSTRRIFPGRRSVAGVPAALAASGAA